MASQVKPYRTTGPNIEARRFRNRLKGNAPPDNTTGWHKNTDPWVTERTDPLTDMGGWFPIWSKDIDAIKRWCRLYRPKPHQWRLVYISTPPQGDRDQVWWRHDDKHDSMGKVVGQGVTPGRHAQLLMGQKNRDRIYQMLTAGKTLHETLDLVGVQPGTYYQWRVRYHDWATKVDTVRAKQGDDRGEEDKDFFSRRRYYFGYESYSHHRQVIQAIEDTPEGGITLILLPPEGGKTTLLENWCADQIAQDPNTRILYVSETAEGHARKVLDELKEMLTDPNLEIPDTQYPSHIPEFIARYGPFRDPTLDKGKPWNNKYIKVHGASGQRDYTFQAVGWKSKVYGARAEWIIFDDVQSSESIGSTKRIYAVLRRTYFSRTRKGKIIFIGTRVDLGDVYEQLEEDGIPSQIVKIPAVNDQGESYWPERWPPEALEQKKKMSKDGWWPVYMMAPQMAKAATFTPGIVEPCFDPTVVLGGTGMLGDYRKVAGLDPALSGPAALGAAAFNMTRFVLLWMEVREQLARNENILAWLAEVARRTPFTELVLELSAVSKGLRGDERLRRMAEEIYGFRIVDHSTTQSSKEDIDFGIGEMAGSFLRGEIVLPYGDTAAREATNTLVHELYRWRPGMQGKDLTQDQVIVLWVMWRRWQMTRNQTAQPSQPERWKVSGVPWTPGDMSGLWTPEAQRETYARGRQRDTRRSVGAGAIRGEW